MEVHLYGLTNWCIGPPILGNPLNPIPLTQDVSHPTEYSYHYPVSRSFIDRLHSFVVSAVKYLACQSKLWRRLAEREGCARSLRSLRSPNQSPFTRERVLIPHFNYLYLNIYGGERGIRTLDPGISGIHDFQSCPFGLSGISPIL